MFERILVPINGSSSAEIALPYVTQIASKFGSWIILVRILDFYEPSQVDKCRTYLDMVTSKMKDSLRDWQAKEEARVNPQLLIGNPASEILNYAREMDCSLIAMASRGESSYGPWPLGSITTKIIRASRFPVLLVRSRVDDSVLKGKKLIRRILMPLDGSKIGEAAIPQIVLLSQAIGAELVLFQVVEPVSGPENSSSETAVWQKKIEVERQLTAISYLNRTKEALKGKVADVSLAIAEGSPADQIVDYSQANDIDLIAMSTHGRSGIGRWVFGSVTEKVLQSGDKPVLIVRAQEETAAI